MILVLNKPKKGLRRQLLLIVLLNLREKTNSRGESNKFGNMSPISRSKASSSLKRTHYRLPPPTLDRVLVLQEKRRHRANHHLPSNIVYKSDYLMEAQCATALHQHRPSVEMYARGLTVYYRMRNAHIILSIS
jgi:hypothetical protein